MSELPAGWAACSVGDIVERIETGKSVKCDERPPLGAENGLIKISAVTWGEFDEQESKTLFDSSHLKPEEKIQLGDFLISRANTLELVGSCVVVKQLSKNLYLSDKVLRLVLPDEAKSWLLVCMRSQAGRKQIESLATGNQLSMRNISQQALRDIRIPLPPLAEQTRIAQKLDELLAQVNTLKARIDAIPTLLKRFRQSALAAAVSGRLTEEWRRQNSGTHSCVVNPQAKPLAMDELAAAEDLLGEALPAFWSKYALEQLVEPERGIPYGIVQTGDAVDVGVPTVRCGDVKNLFIDTSCLKIVSADVEREYKRTRLNGGEVLLAIRGSVGNVGIAPDSLRGCNISREVAMIPPLPSVIPFYLACLLQSPLGQRLLTGKVRGVAQKGINLADVKRLPVALPGVEEQIEIVRRVEQLFAFADQLEAKVATAQARIDRLTQSILGKAFRGELVPQDPNDEPASVLLERIQAQRAAAPKAKRGRKASA